MRHVLIALLAIVSVPANAAEDPKLPADVQARVDEANARKAEAEAKEAQYKAEAEAAKARFEGLPKSPAEGKTDLKESGGKLETDLLVASAFRKAAEQIAKDPKIAAQTGRILILPGSASLDRKETLAFTAQAFGLESAFQYVMPGTSFACDSNGSNSGVRTLGDPISTVGAAVTALSELLKTDITVSGITSNLNEETLARAVAAQNVDRFTTSFFPADLKGSEVVTALCRLQKARIAAEVQLAGLGPDPSKTDPRRAAALARVTEAYDEFLAKLTTPTGDKPAPLVAIMTESAIDKYPSKVLRIWTDAKGGTVIIRRNLWTTLGARSIGMTGGSVISYMLTDKLSGNVLAAGLLHCNTRLVSLRTAHQDAFASAYCEPAR